jgi:hypothetical protein
MVARHPMIVLEMADHTGSMAARRRISWRMIGDARDLAADPDLEPVGIVVAAVALVATDVTDRDTCELFEIGDDRTEGCGLPCSALAKAPSLDTARTRFI